MLIRDEQPADAAAIRALLEIVFPQPDEAKLVDQLRRDGDVAVSLVAVENGAPVGHVLLSPMTAPFRAVGLAPLAVAPHRQGAGIGGQLVRAALARAKADGWQGVFVVGDPDYYRRFGFEPELAAGFASPYAGPYLMALALGPALPTTTGEVAYAPAFAGLE